MSSDKSFRERASHIVFAVCAAILVIAIAAIFIFVGSRAFQTFTDKHISPAAFFFGTQWFPDSGEVGSLVLIVGTLSVTVLAVLLSAPISVGVAVFVTEIAPPWAQRFMQPVLELFTGIPSIVYGLLGLQILVPAVANVYNYLAGGFFYAGFGIIAAAIVLALMILPTITTLSVDAVRALPVGLREASLALGATRWQTIRKTLLPGASSGIFTGIVLGIGRAIGETLAIAFVIGGSANSFPLHFTNIFPYIAFNPTSTITVQLLFDFAEAPNGSLNYDAIWTLAFILLLISLLLVIISRWIASRGVYSAKESTTGSLSGLFRRIQPRSVAQ